MAAPNYDKTKGTYVYVYATIPGSIGLASYCATFTEGGSLTRLDREPELRVQTCPPSRNLRHLGRSY